MRLCYMLKLAEPPPASAQVSVTSNTLLFYPQAQLVTA